MKIELGKQFGRWIILSEEPEENKRQRVLCKCSCGKVKVLYYFTLAKGISESCGCLRNELLQKIPLGTRDHEYRNLNAFQSVTNKQTYE